MWGAREKNIHIRIFYTHVHPAGAGWLMCFSVGAVKLLISAHQLCPINEPIIRSRGGRWQRTAMRAGRHPDSRCCRRTEPEEVSHQDRP
jgi:hypothetical protein